MGRLLRSREYHRDEYFSKPTHGGGKLSAGCLSLCQRGVCFCLLLHTGKYKEMPKLKSSSLTAPCASASAAESQSSSCLVRWDQGTCSSGSG